MRVPVLSILFLVRGSKNKTVKLEEMSNLEKKNQRTYYNYRVKFAAESMFVVGTPARDDGVHASRWALGQSPCKCRAQIR